MKLRLFILPLIILGLSGCSSMYYGTMEKLGVHKRDIMVDRIKEARDTQDRALPQNIHYNRKSSKGGGYVNCIQMALNNSWCIAYYGLNRDGRW
jgi:hypothetical protein